MNLSWVDSIGIIGASTILVEFILNEVHKLTTESLWYDLLNMLGALGLAIYAYLLGSIPFLVLNGI